jgi:thioredoxin reductase (NADPH)
MSDNKLYDVVILGTGPAGLQAAIHAACKKIDVLVMGKFSKSSLFHAHVENICGIYNLAGENMLRGGREQAENFDARFLEEDVLKIESQENLLNFKTESSGDIKSKSLIIATGMTRKKLGVPGEKAYLGQGVSYCVECDANFYREEEVAVMGGECRRGWGLDLAQLCRQGASGQRNAAGE